MLFVQHNLLAENANRQLKASTDKNAKTTEKLSSGYKINRAADDAAGLSISEKMRRQVRGLHQTVDNISEGVGYVQTAEGALNEVQDMLQRINELAIKSANGTNTVEDRSAIDREVQQLKNEMNRIFGTTSFNEQKIWEPGDRKLLGYKPVRAVDYVSTSETYRPTITNKNYAVLPGANYSVSSYSCSYSSSIYSLGSSSSTGYFKINAKEEDGVDGISVEWTGYNGTEYKTNKIKWDQLEAQNYRFEMSSLFDKDKYPDLFDGDEPVFKHEIAFNPAETATIEDIRNSIDGNYISAVARATMQYSWANTVGNKPVVGLSGVVLSYPAAFVSMWQTGDAKNGHNFDAADSDFIKPNKTGNTNLTKHPDYSNKNDSTGWEFSFDMVGIGKVTASSTSVSYWSNDTAADSKDTWWDWCVHTDIYGKETYRHEQRIVREEAGTLSGVMSTLTGADAAAPGLLNKDGGGYNSDNGSGFIEINFKMTAATEFKYKTFDGNEQSSKDVGQFCIRIPVSATDSEDDILNKLKTLDSNTILDFATSGANADSLSFGSLYPDNRKIDAPIYGGICSFYVQAGTEGGQHIEIKYEALSTIVLGMEHTNVRTAESAQRAINEVKGALQMVSEQRSTFGAYQNRIEHAQNINANVEENTQAAESLIRDADIADTMMEHSINNILMQAGTSMLTQANQSSQSILELLG
ncbi:MAG: hypothetical protein K2J99_09840 [Lachnospiraceae bacterium]|nr:hypothetical protein [Lachnospiraceae bacterium]